MIRTSNLIHRGLVNINTDKSLESSEINNMIFGNKIALLCGDYLLSNSCAELAALRNQDVSYLYLLLFLFIYNINYITNFLIFIKFKNYISIKTIFD